MKTTDKSTVELIDHMGSDLRVVNAARVSFDKQSTYDIIGYIEDVDFTSRIVSETPIEELSAKDTKLIEYLAKHNHWSPFAHTSITLRVTAPVFVARQLVKHQVGGVWNEVSRRYVDDEPVFYFPDKWRKRAENKKQGSDDSAVVQEHPEVKQFVEHLVCIYNEMIANDVAPEQARMILPQNMMTSWYWTGSLMFFNRVFRQRTESGAQQETKEVALQIGEICSKLFPVSWEALNEKL